MPPMLDPAMTEACTGVGWISPGPAVTVGIWASVRVTFWFKWFRGVSFWGSSSTESMPSMPSSPSMASMASISSALGFLAGSRGSSWHKWPMLRLMQRVQGRSWSASAPDVRRPCNSPSRRSYALGSWSARWGVFE